MVPVSVAFRDQSTEAPLVSMIHDRRWLVDDSIAGFDDAIRQIAILASQQLLVERSDLFENGPS